MAHANTDPRSETIEVEGHVVTHGCLYRPDLQRWEPVASIRPSWAASDPVSLAAKPETFQDTPEDAMVVAETMVEEWLRAHRAA